ncbi:PulJ/GspJ family protein [Schumannella luteola]
MSRSRSDSGLTLVELMVAGLILSVVLIAIGSITVGILAAQQTVAAVTQTTTAAQASASLIATGVRNASDVRLTTPTGTDQLLIVRTAGSDATLTWTCRAWYYSATAGTIRSTSSSSRITAPTAQQLASWKTVVTDVVPKSGTAVFSVVAGGIKLAYNVQVDDDAPVRIDTTAIKRTGVTEVGTCF